MKLSTKGRYGLLAMISIGSIDENLVISLKNVAEKNNISEPYLERLIARLKRAELVKSTRGSGGGYSLTKDPKLISVGDILRASEGDLNLVDCTSENKVESCSKMKTCPSRYVFDSINKAINEVIDNISLNDLINIEKNGAMGI